MAAEGCRIQRFRAFARPWAAALGLLALLGADARAADRSLEYAVKATFLYKFAPFVDWPPAAFEQPGAPFALCIVGNDPFPDSIERTVAGQHVDGHPVMLRHLAVAEARSDCQLMFITGSPAQSVGDALDAVRGTPTLTVTDTANGAPPGIIQFVVVNDRVNFDIDNAAAAQNHLVVSSKLLALAHAVTPGERR